MLIPRSTLQFDFGSTRFDLEKDRRFLGWVFDQFLYGEVTGIQCGYWLYRSPTLAAASFLARQATEELSHVKRIIKIQERLGVKSNPAHRAVRFLSTGMMGGTWGEHVCLEMALGEGLVLTIFYALSSTIEDPEIRKIIESAIIDEEKHVEFGERETIEWLKHHPSDRSCLLAQALLQAIAMRRLKNFVQRKLSPDHPVLQKFSAFYDHTIENFEKRIHLLGLSPRPLREMSSGERFALFALLPIRKTRMRMRRKRLLTASYLEDEWLKANRHEDETALPLLP